MIWNTASLLFGYFFFFNVSSCFLNLLNEENRKRLQRMKAAAIVKLRVGFPPFTAVYMMYSTLYKLMFSQYSHFNSCCDSEITPLVSAFLFNVPTKGPENPEREKLFAGNMVLTVSLTYLSRYQVHQLLSMSQTLTHRRLCQITTNTQKIYCIEYRIIRTYLVPLKQQKASSCI